jgi:ubiquinone/menaquinone biosynthesis C-methylase UbiE
MTLHLPWPRRSRAQGAAMTDADRPDPRTQRQASARYAESYAESHRGVGDEIAYRAGYIDILVIDRMMTGYTMLDVGCGTGGYLGLARNCAHITAVDFSATMIEQALELQKELGLTRVTFLHKRFEDFEASGAQFDVVRMGGVVGWYKPWIGNEDALAKARGMTKEGGIIVATYVRPATIAHVAKAALFPGRTILISKRRFLRLAAAAQLRHLFSIETPHSCLAFLRKGSVA